MTETGIKGIDVYVGDGTIDWKKVSDDGVKFAMIKATQGYQVSNPKSGKITDSKFEYNITNAYDNGILCGVYHYLMAKTKDEAKAEAEYFISKILPYKDKIKLFAGVDMENDSAKSYLSKEKKLNTDILKEFCDTVERSGFKSIIYINPNFIKNYLEFDRLKDYYIWLAYWTAEETVMDFINGFDDPDQFRIWQYGDETVDGISKKTDGDMALYDMENSGEYPVISIEIPDGGNLGSFLIPGSYYSRSGKCSGVPDDCSGKAFLLEVHAGATEKSNFCLQKVYCIETGKEYRRGLYTKNGKVTEVQMNWR